MAPSRMLVAALIAAAAGFGVSACGSDETGASASGNSDAGSKSATTKSVDGMKVGYSSLDSELFQIEEQKAAFSSLKEWPPVEV